MQSLVDARSRRRRGSHLLSCRTRASGALVTCPMEGMTDTMAGLGSVPWSSRGGLYGHALYFFFVSRTYS